MPFRIIQQDLLDQALPKQERVVLVVVVRGGEEARGGDARAGAGVAAHLPQGAAEDLLAYLFGLLEGEAEGLGEEGVVC